MEVPQWPQVGHSVIYTDERGADHVALLTTIHGAPWNETSGPTVNLLYVSGDESRHDSYGRQIERECSVCHKNVMGVVHGRYWRTLNEDRNAYVEPAQR